MIKRYYLFCDKDMIFSRKIIYIADFIFNNFMLLQI